MSGLAFLPWYPRDFRSSTLAWPPMARLIYRELLDASWDAGGLPADEEQLALIARVTMKDWQAAWRLVEPKFPICADGLRRNPRLEEHRAHSQALRRARSAGAAATNAKRWGIGSRASRERSAGESLSDMPSEALGASPPSPSPSPESEANHTEEVVVPLRPEDRPNGQHANRSRRGRR